MGSLPQPRVQLTAIQQAAIEYVEAGLAIVAVNGKKPLKREWNIRKNAITTVNQAITIDGNVGLADLWSGVVAIDVDDMREALPYLEANGVDLMTMLMADPVRIDSGRKNRAKLLYRIPDGVGALPTHQHTGNTGEMVIELRCADKTGSMTMMDVLPPSIHPDTGEPYTWIGDWRNIPEIPAALLRFWHSVTTAPKAKLSLGSDRPYLELMASIPRTNICSTYGHVLPTAKPFKNSSDASPELLKEYDVLKQVLPVMGFAGFDALFTAGRVSVTCPFREDNHKSGGLIKADDGWVLFKDFADPNYVSYTLAQLYATLITGEIQNPKKVSLATWAMRLLIESGVIRPASVTLPSFTGTPAEMKFYNGMTLLFQCRWRYAPHKGKPIMMAREFMASWCGVGITTAHNTKNKLVKLKVLKQYDSKKRGFLFTPYSKH